MGVLLFHSFGAFDSQPIWTPLEPVRRAAGTGWLGLHLFFVISGYCIFERLATSGARGETARAFWADRFLRIYPTYWAVLAFTVALNLAAWPFNRSHLAGNLPASLVALFGDISLLHGLLLALSRGSARLLPAFVIGLALCGAAIVAPGGHWFMPLLLWPDFFAGACVSFALRAAAGRDRRLLAASLGALAALSAGALGRVGNIGSEAHRAAFGFAWVLLGLYRWDGFLDGLPPVRLLAWIGTFSYSLYLIHVQILSRVMNLGTRVVPPASAGFALLWLAAVATATAGGWYFWRVVEQRCERYRSRRRALRRGAAVTGPPLFVSPT